MFAFLELLTVLVIVVGGIWLFAVRKSAHADARLARAIRARREAMERLAVRGEPLRCLGCGHAFAGPLPETGCPVCGVSALVVAEKDYAEI